jgi:hypothetical protein
VKARELIIVLVNFGFIVIISFYLIFLVLAFFDRLAEVALPPSTGSSATLGDGLAEACQRSPPSYDDGTADRTAGLAGRKVHALVQGVAASSTSVPPCSANNGVG